MSHIAYRILRIAGRSSFRIHHSSFIIRIMRAIREVLSGLSLAVLTTATVLGGIFLSFSETGGQIPNSQLQTSNLQSPTTLSPDQQTTGLPDPSTATAGLPDYSTTRLPDYSTAQLPDYPTATAGLPDYPTTRLPDYATTIVCGPPPGWVIYTAQAGDNLFRLSLRYGTSISALQQANCLTDISISAGQRLYVPPVVVITNTAIIPSASAVPTVSSATPTPTDTLTATASATDTQPAPSATPSPTATLASTDTATSLPTSTNTPTATDTPTATNTPTP